MLIDAASWNETRDFAGVDGPWCDDSRVYVDFLPNFIEKKL